MASEPETNSLVNFRRSSGAGAVTLVLLSEFAQHQNCGLVFCQSVASHSETGGTSSGKK